jgi:hypothetical protein
MNEASFEGAEFDDTGSDDDSSDFGDGGDGGFDYSSDDEGANDAIAYLGDLPDYFDDDDLKVTRTFFSGLDDKLSPEVGQELLNRYSAMVEAEEGKTSARDIAQRDLATAGLRKTWGAEYDANINHLKSAIKGQPFADDLLDARFPDGSAVFNDARFSQWLLKLVKGTNMQRQEPGYRPNPGSSNRNALMDEKESIEGKMGTREYTKNPRMQSRYRELLKLLGQAT